MPRLRGQRLTGEQLAKLREAYARDDKQLVAAADANVAPGTVNRYFARWRAEGRARVRRLPLREPGRPTGPKTPPRYTGPVWIGKRITRDA